MAYVTYCPGSSPSALVAGGHQKYGDTTGATDAQEAGLLFTVANKLF